MNKARNLVTYKIKYSCNESLLEVLNQYNCVLKFTYNRLLENSKLTTKELTALQKTLNNCDLIGSHLKNSAIYDAKSLVEKSTEPIIFGGKNLFMQRCQHKISKEDFIIKRLRHLNCVGEACKGANRHFKIINNSIIQFNLNKHYRFNLHLQNVGTKRSKELSKLIELQNNCQMPITYKLDLDYVYLTFDYNVLKTYAYKVKQNRVLAIDLNPNSIGWSVVDWLSEDNYNLIQAGTFSLKPLNDYRDSKSVASSSDFHKYITNKRKHEVIHIAKQLFEICKHYKCEIFAIENLNMKTSDKSLGHRFNKLVNNVWCRDLLIQQIKKHVNSSSTILVEVQPQWNSYIGNLVFRQEHLPDECLASIEIGRRGFEFATQYIFNRRLHKKTVIFPELELVKSQIALSLEELGIDVPNFDSWMNILFAVKKSGVKYRFSTSEAKKWHTEGLFSKKYNKLYLKVYTFI